MKKISNRSFKSRVRIKNGYLGNFLGYIGMLVEPKTDRVLNNPRNKETLNLTKHDGVFIVHNNSNTIIGKDASITEAYNKYKILKDKIEKEFSSIGIDPNITNQETQGNRSTIKIKGSNRLLIIFFVLFIGIVTYLGYSFDFRGVVKDVSFELKNAVNSTIRETPSTLKNTLLYKVNGEPRCFPCILNEMIDNINKGTSNNSISDADMDRLKEKINSLKLQYGFGEPEPEPELENKDDRLGIKIKDDEPAIILRSDIGEIFENSDTNVTLTATAPEPATSDITVTIATSGDAIDGIDYSPINGTTITIPAGSTTGYKKFMVIDDSDGEGLENIYIEISNVSYGAYENKE